MSHTKRLHYMSHTASDCITCHTTASQVTAAHLMCCDAVDGYCSTLDGYCSTLDGYCSTLDGYCSTLDGYCSTLDGYCSTVQGLLDWFEVDVG